MPTNIRIAVIQPNDRARVLSFLRIHYYQEEPLTVGCEPKQQDDADEEFNLSNIEYGTCVMALQLQSDSSERIVGAMLAGPKDKNEAEHLFEEAERLGNTKWGKIVKFLAGVERDANVWQHYAVEKALHLHVMGVDSQMRGQRVGERMLHRLEELGRSLGYPVLTADCTSFYSARLIERLGFECINVAFYRDYKDEHGEQVFSPPAPHVSVKTYAKRLMPPTPPS